MAERSYGETEPVGDLDEGLRALAPRDHFAATRTISYLNSAGIGLVPFPVQEAVCEFGRALGANGTEAYFERYDELMDHPRRIAAKLLSAPLENVAIITSISEAISQIAWWRRPKAHENVVVVDIDCSPVTYPWLRVAQETGAEVRFVRVADAPDQLDLDAIAQHVDRNTAAISISHVQWITGLRLDLKALAVLAKDHDALLVIDAMHSAGVTSHKQAAG